MSSPLMKWIKRVIAKVEPLNIEKHGGEPTIPEMVQAVREYFPHLAVISGDLYFWYCDHYVKLDDIHQEKSFFLNKFLMKLLGKSHVSTNLIGTVYTELLNDYFVQKQIQNSLCTINLKNGMLSINKAREDLYEHHPEYGYRYVLPYEYDPEAKAPRFEAFLAETVGDENSIKVIYEYMGYILLGKHRSFESALILLGEGRNGKSVLVKTLTKFVGEENTSYVELQDLGNINRVVMIDGKLLNVGSDSSHKNFDTSQFKRAISGEPILGKRLYKDSYFIKDIPKFIFAMNNLPNSQGDTSLGLIRRMKIIHFEKIIAEDKIDSELDKKLEAELPGILNLAIEGMRRLIKQGHFTESKAINQAVKSYEDNINMVKRFIDDLQIMHDSNARVSNKQLYAMFKLWCEDEGIKTPPQKCLNEKMKSAGFQTYKNNTIRGFMISFTQPIQEISSMHLDGDRKARPIKNARQLLQDQDEE